MSWLRKIRARRKVSRKDPQPMLRYSAAAKRRLLSHPSRERGGGNSAFALPQKAMANDNSSRDAALSGRVRSGLSIRGGCSKLLSMVVTLKVDKA